MAEVEMTSLVLELDKQINELRERAQVEPGNAALRLQLDELVQQQINALFDSSRKIIEQVDDALKICRKARAEIGATQAMLARRDYLEAQIGNRLFGDPSEVQAMLEELVELYNKTGDEQ